MVTIGTSQLETFAQAFKSQNGEVTYTRTREETSAALKAAVFRHGARRVAVAGLPSGVREAMTYALGDVELIDAGKLNGKEAKLAIAGADMGVTWAAYGLAKEGALLETTWDDATKLASCLPMTHVALVSERNLLPDFAAGMREAGRIVAASQNPKPIISFISGPSRTLDIESRLLYGVHGPHSVIVLVLGWT